MKLVHLGAISTGMVVVLGLAMVIPAFTQHQQEVDPRVPIMLSFSISGNGGAGWCQDISSLLANHEIKATVFVTGKTAQSTPECVLSFSSSAGSNIDVGSQTYSFADLTSVEYTTALEEINSGKQAVDNAGNIDSKIFTAPYGATDENIYSLLSRSGILADFSYKSQYNKSEDGQFVKYDLKSLTGDSEGLQIFSLIFQDDDRTPALTRVPVMINFDDSMSVEHIDKFISQLKSSYSDSIRFVNASELTGIDLTVRRGEESAI